MSTIPVISGNAENLNPESRATNRLWALDATRAFAALMVLCYHALLHLPSYGQTLPVLAGVIGLNLWTGVDLFFALSGYLVGSTFVRVLAGREPKPHIGAFSLRRASRIFPAYWLLLIVWVALGLANPLTLERAALHVGLLQNLVPGEATALFDPAWTLGLEIEFYAFLPLTLLLVGRHRKSVMSPGHIAILVMSLWLGSGLLALVAGYSPVNSPWNLLAVNLPGALFFFCPGLLVAVAELASKGQTNSSPIGKAYVWISDRWYIALISALSLWLIAAQLNIGATPLAVALRNQLLAVSSGLAVFVGVQLSAKRPLFPRTLALASGMSYALYLWHPVLDQRVLPALPLGLLQGLPELLIWVLYSTVLLILTAPVAWFSWTIVEQPIMRRTVAAARRSITRGCHP
jgi:peptidoglycan/LPS O-acetylase OafA/YrhL